MSLAALPEHEIQKRIKLGLVTNASGHDASATRDGDEDEDLEEWEDFEDPTSTTDNTTKDGETDGTDDEFAFGKTRRSSVDLASLSENSHDDWESDAGSTGSFSSDFEPNKRHRSKEPVGVTPIDEEEADDEDDDEEIATVNGEDDDIELRDADAATTTAPN